MTQRETHGMQFTECPECGQSFGTRGIARHRKQIHDVQPVTTRKAKAKRVVPTQEERAARLAALASWCQAENAKESAMRTGEIS